MAANRSERIGRLLTLIASNERYHHYLFNLESVEVVKLRISINLALLDLVATCNLTEEQIISLMEQREIACQMLTKKSLSQEEIQTNQRRPVVTNNEGSGCPPPQPPANHLQNDQNSSTSVPADTSSFRNTGRNFGQQLPERPAHLLDPAESELEQRILKLGQLYQPYNKLLTVFYRLLKYAKEEGQLNETQEEELINGFKARLSSALDGQGRGQTFQTLCKDTEYHKHRHYENSRVQKLRRSFDTLIKRAKDIKLIHQEEAAMSLYATREHACQTLTELFYDLLLHDSPPSVSQSNASSTSRNVGQRALPSHNAESVNIKHLKPNFTSASNNFSKAIITPGVFDNVFIVTRPVVWPRMTFKTPAQKASDFPTFFRKKVYESFGSLPLDLKKKLVVAALQSRFTKALKQGDYGFQNFTPEENDTEVEELCWNNTNNLRDNLIKVLIEKRHLTANNTNIGEIIVQLTETTFSDHPALQVRIQLFLQRALRPFLIEISNL